MSNNNKMKNIKPKVKIFQHDRYPGYFIEVKDKHTANRLAVTEAELTEIVTQGKVIVMKLLNK